MTSRTTPKLTELVYRKGHKQWNAWLLVSNGASQAATGITGITVLNVGQDVVGAGNTADNAGRDFQKQWRAYQRRQEAEIQKDILNG